MPTPSLPTLDRSETSRIIEMAWEDRTPFEAIETCYGVSEKQVVTIMRTNLKPHSFRNWRQRMNRRATKHLKLRGFVTSRGYCSTQYKIRSK